MSFNPTTRGIHRKTYPNNRYVPKTIFFGSASLDANRYQREYNYFTLPIYPGSHLTSSNVTYGLYEEGLITFDHNLTKTTTFSTSFAQEPVIALSVEGQDNVNPFIVSATNLGFIVGVSSELSGTVRYRAIYADSYPVYILSGGVDVLCSATSSFIANQSNFSIPFSSLGALPARLFLSTEDYSTNKDVNVQILTSSIGLTYVSGSLSAPINNRLNLLVMAT